MTRIFLSYARGDDVQPYDPATSWVQRLSRELTAAGFDVWFDHLSLPSRGLTFHQEIRDAIAACNRLLLVVGPQAASSEYVQQEWQFAWFEAEKVVTPILRSGDYPLAIPELALLHAEEARNVGELTGEKMREHFDTGVRRRCRATRIAFSAHPSRC